MFCNNCGEKLADDAKFCTKCGSKVNNDPEMGSIVFKRLGQFYGSIAQIKVFLDGQMVTSLGTNQEIRINVPIGVHKISFDYWCGSGENQVVLTKENPNIRVNIKLGAGLVTSNPKIASIENI
jgi:archaellum component FlaF (FlaF/FlaG flagellin family)